MVSNEILDELWKLLGELSKKEKLLKQSCDDWAEDHTYLQETAKRIGIDSKRIYGNSYGVPGIQELVDMIVEHLSKKS